MEWEGDMTASQMSQATGRLGIAAFSRAVVVVIAFSLGRVNAHAAHRISCHLGCHGGSSLKSELLALTGEQRASGRGAVKAAGPVSRFAQCVAS